MASYSEQQKKYIDSVGGEAHQSAVEIIGLLEKVIKAQSRLLVSYRVGGQPPEWVFDILERAGKYGIQA